MSCAMFMYPGEAEQASCWRATRNQRGFINME